MNLQHLMKLKLPNESLRVPHQVAKMRAKTEAAGMQGIEWRQADMLDLPFAGQQSAIYFHALG